MFRYAYRVEIDGVVLGNSGRRSAALERGQSLRFTSVAEDYWLRVLAIEPQQDGLPIVRLCPGPLTRERLIFEGWTEVCA